MRILYGVLSQGQGHINRAAVLVRRLRARGHRVDVVLSGDSPPIYTKHVLGDFDLIPVANLILANGVLARRKTAESFACSLPQRLRAIHGLARRLVRDRIDLVLTDFEPISAWSARRARVPVIGISGQYRITRTNAVPPQTGRAERLFAKVIMEAWTPPLTRYFAVSFVNDSATRARTTVVSPIVDERLRERPPTRAGFYLAYLYSYEPHLVVNALKDHGGVPFRVYGLGAREAIGNVTFCATDRSAFVNDLLACEGVILNGSFQGVCEAASVKKPILSVPFQGQYEELFNAYQLERAGLGLSANALSLEAVERLLAFSLPPNGAARTMRTNDGAAETLDALGL